MVNRIAAEVVNDAIFSSGDFVPVKVVLDIEEPIVISSLILTLSGYVITSAFAPQKQVESPSTLVPANDYYHRFLFRAFELNIDSKLNLEKGRYEIESRVEIPDKNTLCECKRVEVPEEAELVPPPTFLLPPSYTHETQNGDFIAVSYLVLPLANEDTLVDPMTGLDPKISYSPCQIRVRPAKTSIPPAFLTSEQMYSVEAQIPGELAWRMRVDAFGDEAVVLSLGSRVTACAFFRAYPMKDDGAVSLTRHIRPGEMLNRDVSFSLGLSFPRRVAELPDKIKIRCQLVKVSLVEEVEYPKTTESDGKSSESSTLTDVSLTTSKVKTKEILDEDLNEDITFELYHVSQPEDHSGHQKHYIFQCPPEWFEVAVPQTSTTFATAVLSHQYKLVVDFVFSTIEEPSHRISVSVESEVFINDDFARKESF
ncbi:uncharacterized protein CXQ87_005022 [Candidozyma duobushaemuli]|uniref:Uncharacterized protein n=2 Tax=Candidozyma TaxID=3303203 RepID=A0ABX8IAV7_9ASCO|nr:uncharacterized protein CXQ87_005022 [[Candida] duobushaemulonis]PVH14746.1 hypothetical protein CXQ87_005022 [[Candida] duobushaemulonis]QWU90157.1 hypothetical protein CA3LBN_004515 [[Candida] haemuloni]